MAHLFSFCVIEAVGQVYRVVEEGGLAGRAGDDWDLVLLVCLRQVTRYLRTVSLSSSKIFILLLLPPSPTVVILVK